MADALKSASLWDGLRHRWSRSRLRDQRFAFMWDAAPDNEWVSLDCETTGLNRRSDDIISIGAVRIVGNRVMTSERLELLVRPVMAERGRGGRQCGRLALFHHAERGDRRPLADWVLANFEPHEHVEETTDPRWSALSELRKESSS